LAIYKTVIERIVSKGLSMICNHACPLTVQNVAAHTVYWPSNRG